MNILNVCYVFFFICVSDVIIPRVIIHRYLKTRRLTEFERNFGRNILVKNAFKQLNCSFDEHVHFGRECVCMCVRAFSALAQNRAKRVSRLNEFNFIRLMNFHAHF